MAKRKTKSSPAPEKDVFIGTRVSKDQADLLETAAHEHGTTVSVLVRIAIRALTLGKFGIEEADVDRESRPAPRKRKKGPGQ